MWAAARDIVIFFLEWSIAWIIFFLNPYKVIKGKLVEMVVILLHELLCYLVIWLLGHDNSVFIVFLKFEPVSVMLRKTDLSNGLTTVFFFRFFIILTMKTFKRYCHSNIFYIYKDCRFSLNSSTDGLLSALVNCSCIVRKKFLIWK